MFRIPFDEVKGVLRRILLTRGCPVDKAETVALEIARNSLEGAYTHGINRFARLVRNIDEGVVRPDAMPEKVNGYGAIENWDGNLGLGIINACFAMRRTVDLARGHGIGLVAIRNTNHWMRAATYACQACEAGMAALCFSNTTPNMPAWGAADSRLGNNPLTLAFPSEKGPVVADLAMSQFSYGKLELAQLQGKSMPVDAGFDSRGELTRDPGEIINSKRILPMGYWKGAALSFLLDIFAGCLSLGNTVAGIGRLQGDEHGVSQVFIAVNYREISPEGQAEAILKDAVEDLLNSKPDGSGARIAYPGQRALKDREENARLGIPVDGRVWDEIMRL